MKTFKRDILGVINKKGQFSCIGLTDENSMIGYNHLRNINRVVNEEDQLDMRNWKKIPKLIKHVVRAVDIKPANPTNTQVLLSTLDVPKQEENPNYQELKKDIYSLQREGMFIWPKNIISASGLIAKNLSTILGRADQNLNSEAVVFNKVEPAQDHFKIDICGWYNAELDANNNREHSFFVLSPKNQTRTDNIKFYFKPEYETISYTIGDKSGITPTYYRPHGNQIEMTWFHAVWNKEHFCCLTKDITFDILRE